MSTFVEAGKEFNDLYQRSFIPNKNLEVNFRPIPDILTVSLRGIFKETTFEGQLIPAFSYKPLGVEGVAILSSPDEDESTATLAVSLPDALTSGFTGEFNFNNGKKAEFGLGGTYRNLKFGGITGKLGIPLGAPKYLATSLYIENADTNGVGIGGSVKINSGEEITVDSWKAMITYKRLFMSGFFGAEQKLTALDKSIVVKEDSQIVLPSYSVYIIGGLMKLYENNNLFALQGAYNTTLDRTSVDFLFKKSFDPLTFYKIKAGINGKISTARQFSVPNGTILVCADADLLKQTGTLGFQASTNF